MAIEFVDSFDHYKLGNTISDPVLLAQLNAKWTSNFLRLDIENTGRTGNCLTITYGSFIFKTVTHQSSWSGVLAFRANTGNAGGGPIYILNNNGTNLFKIVYNFDNTLSLYAGNNVIGTTNQAIHQYKWFSIGWDVTLSGSSNIAVTASLWVNGSKWLNAVSGSSGINANSLPSQDATGNVHVLESGLGTAGNSSIDDFVVCNSATAFNNGGFFGDARIIAIYPNADDLTGFATATPHFSLINEHAPDDDATYIEDSVAATKDTWDWDQIALSGIIKGLQYLLYAKKTDEGTKVMNHNVGPAGAELVGPDVYLSDDYIYHHIPMDTDPATGAAFTVTNFNNKDFGVQIKS